MSEVLPLYKTSPPTFEFGESNAGLWYDKFCNKWCMDPEKKGLNCWSLEAFEIRPPEGKMESINPKRKWISSVIKKDNDEKRVGNKALEGFDLAPIRRALNSCVNIFNLYGCF